MQMSVRDRDNIFEILATFSGILCPGRYLTFSWIVLIMLVNFSLLMISSYTYIVTRVSNMLLYFMTFAPTIFAIAEPLKLFVTYHKKILCTNNILSVINTLIH